MKKELNRRKVFLVSKRTGVCDCLAFTPKLVFNTEADAVDYVRDKEHFAYEEITFLSRRR